MADKEFRVRHGLVVGNNVLVANSVTGNVGIGVANPQYTIDIVGTINASNILVNGGAVAANLAPVFNVTNAAFDTANAVFGNANLILSVAQAAFDRANSSNDVLFVAASFNTANAAYDKANAGGANVAQTAPTGANPGQLWWSPTSARLYIYYTDANSSQWVEASPSGSSIDGTVIAGYINPVFDIANAAFGVANGAFASANNVAPQVAPSYNTANAAFGFANGVSTNTTAAFAKANAALANATGTVFSGNLRVSGTVSVPVFYENDANITSNISITAGRNAMTAGPVTLNTGVVVEVPAGSVWTIV